MSRFLVGKSILFGRMKVSFCVLARIFGSFLCLLPVILMLVLLLWAQQRSTANHLLDLGYCLRVRYMAIAFTQLAWWLSSGKHKEPRIPNGPSLNPSPDSMWESDILKFPLSRKKPASSSRNIKRQWRSREERKMDKEYDFVLVPSDGGCISGSESDDSDWSIGWLEPHGASFQSDDESDDSFAVLVPCYGRVREDLMDEAESKITVDAIGVVADILPAESKKYVEQWLCSLQNS